MYIHVCVDICTHTNVNILNKYVHIYKNSCIHIHVCVYRYMYIYIYTYICMYTYMYV